MKQFDGYFALTDALGKGQQTQKEVVEECPYQNTLESSKKTIIQGSLDLLLVRTYISNEALYLFIPSS